MEKLYLFLTTATLFSGCVAVVDDRHHHDHPHHRHHDAVIIEERPAVVEVR